MAGIMTVIDLAVYGVSGLYVLRGIEGALEIMPLYIARTDVPKNGSMVEQRNYYRAESRMLMGMTMLTGAVSYATLRL